MSYDNFRKRDNRGGGFRRFGNRPRGPREMHKVVCSECGKETEVPFKPKEGLPVYCKECYMKKKGITPREERSEQAEVKDEDISEDSDETSSEELPSDEEESNEEFDEESSEEDSEDY